MSSRIPDINRRRFLQTAATAVTPQLAAQVLQGAGQRVALVVDPSDQVCSQPAPQWATKHLEEVLRARGVEVRRHARVDQAGADELCIVAAGAASEISTAILQVAGVKVAAEREALALVQAKSAGRPVLLACGHDARGLVYALLELADRAEFAAEPVASLAVPKPLIEKPANAIRSVSRLFVSDVEDKPWYNDREMWPRYLTMLATQRFNRFNLSFGIGYDFLREVTDAYFLFAYPFLLSVPGYKVRAAGLPDAERDRNLEMLKFISTETVARGMQFQLGIWTHGYEWINSPNPNYTIEGLTPDTHAAYCRDAVSALLKECPAISGVTFRVHGESGVDEGSYDFWKTVFDGVVKCGRKVEIDMHSKGMDQAMLDVAVATGLPFTVSPKYWAEHMGMPYHQADIRDQEVPRSDRQASRLMKLSAGSRSFTRYGYADLMREDRRWGILHRIWPGTQRVLLWGDPVTAAAHSRAFGFCGSDGVEIFEPLSFKGRRGSGIAGDRCAYADSSLKPRWDWEKYLYTHRVWGRALYNPDGPADSWRRYMRSEFGDRAQAAEQALSCASRILPIVTTAHGVSAANNTYWTENYTNQPIVNPDRPHPYRDTPAPRVFGNVSPFDPQLFSRINDFVDEALRGERSGKYSPIEVAEWLEAYAQNASKHLAALGTPSKPSQRRLSIDVAIEAGLGRFFAAKFRAGVLYGIYQRSGDRTALEEALKSYRKARAAWAELANRAKRVYKTDITIGEKKELRGHWLDRLASIDEDLADMAQAVPQPGAESNERIRLVLQTVLRGAARPSASCRHTPPARFRAGEPITVELSIEKMAKPVEARLHYRHVNHAERYQSGAMEVRDLVYRAVIAGTYTDSVYPIAYYFELREAPDRAWLYPGFTPELTNQPYFVVRQAS